MNTIELLQLLQHWPCDGQWTHPAIENASTNMHVAAYRAVIINSRGIDSVVQY